MNYLNKNSNYNDQGLKESYSWCLFTVLCLLDYGMSILTSKVASIAEQLNQMSISRFSEKHLGAEVFNLSDYRGDEGRQGAVKADLGTDAKVYSFRLSRGPGAGWEAKISAALRKAYFSQHFSEKSNQAGYGNIKDLKHSLRLLD